MFFFFFIKFLQIAENSMQNYQRNRAKLDQQKYDNKSTNGSEYFEQIFLPFSFNISNTNQKTHYKQENKYINEYKMSQQSFQINEQKDMINSQASNYRQKANPFLSNNYSKIFKHKKDIVTQQSPYKKTYLNSRKQSEMKQNYYQQAQGIYQSPQIKVTKADNFLLKRNKSSQSFYENSDNMRNSKASLESTKFTKLDTCESFELQKKLKLVHSTIKNQKILLQGYKHFIEEQKQKVKNQFILLQKQISNFIADISTTFCKNLDQDLIRFISSMRQTKNQVQILFYGKVQQRIDQQKIDQNSSRLMNQKQKNLNHYETQRLGLNKMLTQIDYSRSPNKLSNVKDSYFCSNSQLLNQINHQNNLLKQKQKLNSFYSCEKTKHQFKKLFQVAQQVQHMYKRKQAFKLNTMQKVQQTANNLRNRLTFNNQC